MIPKKIFFENLKLQEPLVSEFHKLVKETDDLDIKSLLSMMVEEIPSHDINGKLYRCVDISKGERKYDCEFLLAKVLLDLSSNKNINQIYLKGRLENLAWDNGNHVDLLTDWVNAQKNYVRKGLDYLTRLITTC